MPVSVTITLNQKGIRRLLKSRTGPVARDVMARGRRVQSAARIIINSQTGRLSRSIEVTLITARGEIGSSIGTTLSYARAVHDGTGVYGSSGRPIRPKRGKAIVFRGGGRAGGGKVFVSSVSGQRGIRYLERALRAAG